VGGYVATRQIRLSVAEKQSARRIIPAVAEYQKHIPITGLIIAPSTPACHQRNNEYYTGCQKNNAADKVQHIATYNGRSDKENGAYQK